MKSRIACLFNAGPNSCAVDAALLLLRIMATTSLIYHHGLSKVFEWSILMTHPANDPLGLGMVPSLLIAGFTDLVCALFILFGLGTRIASFFCVGTLAVVFFFIDHALRPPFWPAQHPARAELTWVYAACFLVLLIAGAGRYSIDAKLPRGKCEK